MAGCGDAMSKEHVRLLKMAKKEFRPSSQPQYICVCIPTTKEGREIREQISLDLGNFGTLESWLSHVHDKCSWSNNEKVRLTRLAWIDALIEYWRDKP